jgi:hypothetical protein
VDRSASRLQQSYPDLADSPNCFFAAPVDLNEAAVAEF